MIGPPPSGSPLSPVTSVNRTAPAVDAGAMPRMVMSDAGLKASTGRPGSGPSTQSTCASDDWYGAVTSIRCRKRSKAARASANFPERSAWIVALRYGLASRGGSGRRRWTSSRCRSALSAAPSLRSASASLSCTARFAADLSSTARSRAAYAVSPRVRSSSARAYDTRASGATEVRTRRASSCRPVSEYSFARISAISALCGSRRRACCSCDSASS